MSIYSRPFLAISLTLCRSYPVILTFFLALSLSIHAAEDNLFDLDLKDLMRLKVVTAASGFEQNIKEAPSSVTVIDAAEWQARGAKNLTQALQGATNLEVNSVNSAYNAKYTMRGLSGHSGQQIVILIDGVPINTLFTGGGPSLSELPLQGYKRIEIIRSPGSVVYGADAFGGIINLVSYGINEQPDEISVTLGEFEATNIGINKSFILSDIKFQVSANHQSFDDDPDRMITRDAQSTLDGIFNSTASNAPGSLNSSYESFALKGKMEWQALSLYYNGIDGDMGFGAGAAQALDPYKQGNYQHHLVGIDYDLSSLIQDTALNGDLQISAIYNYQKINSPFTLLPAGAVLPIGSDGNLNFTAPTTSTTFTDGFIGQPGNTTDRYHLSIKHLFFVESSHQLRWELGYEKQTIKAFEKKNFGPSILDGTETTVDGTLTDVTNTPYIYLPNKQRDIIFASIQDQWQLTETLQLNVGARFDDYSDAGPTFNPRVGINWNASNKLSIQLFSGSAVRAPNFADLYIQNNPVTVGNVNIKPEEIMTHELSGDYEFTDNLHSIITFFSYKADKLVGFVINTASGAKKPENVGKQEAVGLEWEFQWRPLKSIDLSGNYSYTDSDDGNNNDTRNYAKQLAAFIINWYPTEHIHTNITSNWVKDRERPDGDIRAEIKDYTLVTAKVSYGGLASGIEVSASVNNLLDDDIRHPSDGTIPDDFPQAGRQWLAEIVYRF